MTEILTESFCERCGTRYTFESAAPRKSRLGRVRVLGKGMRNFVLSDDASLSEAMADARSEEEIAATSNQLDAFHQTFNFCLTCRQYTCGDCWNGSEGRCLTCAPIPGMDLPIAAAVPLVEIAAEPTAAEAANGHAEPEAWPDADLSSARLARALGLDDAEAEAAAVAPDAGAISQDGVASPAAAAVEPGPEAAAEDLAAQLIGIAPGQSLEDALAEYEARLVADEVDGQAPATDVSGGEAIAAVTVADTDAIETDETGEEDAEALAAMATAAIAGLARDHAADVEAEPVAAAAVEAEPVAAAAVEAEPVVDAPPRDDLVPQPVWPTPSSPAAPPAAPAPGGDQAPPANPWLTVAPEDPGADPQWPVTPTWPTPASRRDMPATLAGRPLLPGADPSGLWAASAREVLTASAVPVPEAAAAPAPTAQPCVSCGLSLSANARFCRRCGTRQG